MKAQYYPIEIDHRIPRDEKMKHMEAWYGCKVKRGYCGTYTQPGLLFGLYPKL